MSKFNPSRGGHAPGHLREMFAEYVETGEVPTDVLYDESVTGGRNPLDWLCGQLWNCTDTLPGEMRADLDNAASTYAQAARLVMSGRWRGADEAEKALTG
jgi:hypothetical protein